MTEWKDVSAYSKLEKERKPKSFVLDAGSVRLIATRHIHCSPDEWQISVAMGTTEKVAASKDLREAQDECVKLALAILRNAVKQLEETNG